MTSKLDEATREHLKTVPTHEGCEYFGVEHRTRHIGLTTQEMRDWTEFQVWHAFVKGTDWLFSQAQALAFPQGTEDQVIRLSDLKKLVKEQ